MMSKLISILLMTMSFGIAAKDFNLVVQKNTNREEFSFLPNLPNDACKTVEQTVECEFGEDTKVRWGAGYCEESKVAIQDLEKSYRIKLLINEKVVSSDLVSKDYETYDRDYYPFCHTWLVEISDFQKGHYVFKAIKNDEVIEVVNIEVY